MKTIKPFTLEDIKKDNENVKDVEYTGNGVYIITIKPTNYENN